MSRRLAAALLTVSVVALSACSEKPQTAGTAKRSDSKVWQRPQTPYTAPGWKAGDTDSWATQIRARNQAQNEYSRSPAAPAAQ